MPISWTNSSTKIAAWVLKFSLCKGEVVSQTLQKFVILFFQRPCFWNLLPLRFDRAWSNYISLTKNVEITVLEISNKKVVSVLKAVLGKHKVLYMPWCMVGSGWEMKYFIHMYTHIFLFPFLLKYMKTCFTWKWNHNIVPLINEKCRQSANDKTCFQEHVSNFWMRVASSFRKEKKLFCPTLQESGRAYWDPINISTLWKSKVIVPRDRCLFVGLCLSFFNLTANILAGYSVSRNIFG